MKNVLSYFFFFHHPRNFFHRSDGRNGRISYFLQLGWPEVMSVFDIAESYRSIAGNFPTLKIRFHAAYVSRRITNCTVTRYTRGIDVAIDHLFVADDGFSSQLSLQHAIFPLSAGTICKIADSSPGNISDERKFVEAIP